MNEIMSDEELFLSAFDADQKIGKRRDTVLVRISRGHRDAIKVIALMKGKTISHLIDEAVELLLEYKFKTRV